MALLASGGCRERPGGARGRIFLAAHFFAVSSSLALAVCFRPENVIGTMSGEPLAANGLVFLFVMGKPLAVDGYKYSATAFVFIGTVVTKKGECSLVHLTSVTADSRTQL